MSIASSSTIVKFHEFPSGNVLHNYQPGTHADGPIRSISWSKDGNWLALVPNSGFAEIVSVKDQLKLIHTIQGIEEPTCASFQNTTKKNIAIGTKGGQVLIYDIKARSVKKRYPRAMSAITMVEFTAKDSHVVAACETGEANLYSNVQNNLSATFKIPRSQSISALRTNPIKRNYIAAGSEEGVVAVWDIHGNKTKFFIGSHQACVTSVAFSPINSDLVVSSGLDRQFCFYDIGGHKCIGNIFVENSIISVDFSPDGKFIAMASQKGNIYVYDSRNMQQPLHSFFSHNSAVQHLAFRKCEDYESSFNMSETPKEPNTTSDSRHNQQSIEIECNTEAANSITSTSIPSTTVDDSFLVAVGLQQNSNAESLKEEISFKPSESLMSRVIPERLQNEMKTATTSTPDNIIREESPTISPILNSNVHFPLDQNKTNMEELVKTSLEKLVTTNMEELVKTTVTEELKIVSQDLKNEIKYYFTDNMYQIRQMFLDLVMSQVKESIKMENQFNSLRADLINEAPENELLLRENLMLRDRIAFLEEEISLLKK